MAPSAASSSLVIPMAMRSPFIRREANHRSLWMAGFPQTRSVVTGDVAPYTVVGGNPARQVKERFAPEVAARLQAIAWWDWPVEHITANLPFIVAGDVALPARLPPHS